MSERHHDRLRHAVSRELIHRTRSLPGAAQSLKTHCAVVVERYFSAEQCASWVSGVYEARDEWTHDFGGEQFSLGRAFYTHFEEDRSKAYFADPKGSDALVEKHTPGLQLAMRDAAASALNARVIARRGWCGPGVHVFPPGEPVAERGGVCHFDTEGLPTRRLGQAAFTLVAMLQKTESGGGLKVWDVRYEGHDHPSEAELTRSNAIAEYEIGDLVMIESYRLHQIQPFDGETDRISATIHLAEIDVGLFESWF